MRVLKSNFRHFVIFIFILSVSQLVHAQYKINKKEHNYKDYTYQETDKYHPAIAGVASYVLPGLGQIYCNENKRGFNFLMGYLGGGSIMITGAIIDLPNLLGNNHQFTLGKGMIIGGALLSASIQIWSTVDAVRVAKVNNMAHRNNNKIGMSLLFNPNVIVNGNQTTAITLAITF